jgi:hypothetical protein
MDAKERPGVFIGYGDVIWKPEYNRSAGWGQAKRAPDGTPGALLI